MCGGEVSVGCGEESAWVIRWQGLGEATLRATEALSRSRAVLHHLSLKSTRQEIEKYLLGDCGGGGARVVRG
ncbi:hypothetical protein E2C01_093867 [Portunus trituberculatus]|uniref:Uncharacterized protein n=1 Tax=Portunus trituberculatus TaxID=210409 RepID=A0A5B7K1K0_PORTR|nr:hypothetical protein [Portunus trituberculatus]